MFVLLFSFFENVFDRSHKKALDSTTTDTHMHAQICWHVQTYMHFISKMNKKVWIIKRDCPCNYLNVLSPDTGCLQINYRAN